LGRYGGFTGIMKQMKKRLAKRRGVPQSKAGTRMASMSTGLRIPDTRIVKPGFVVKIIPRQVRYNRQGEEISSRQPKGTAPHIGVALKQMKRWNPRLDRPTQRKKERNRK